MITLYALCEPGTRTVRYIGKTVSLKRRWPEHLTASLRHRDYLGNWLRSLQGVRPELVPLRQVTDDEGSFAEIKYIRIARSLGMKLVNATDGGEGVTMTDNTRRKISKALKGRTLSDEHRRRLSEARKGSKNPMFGKAHTPEHSARVSAAQSGKKHSKQWREAISRGLTGRTRSPEHRAALSRAIKGRVLSLEWRGRIAAAMRGKKSPKRI